jgi:hypothetical protein
MSTPKDLQAEAKAVLESAWEQVKRIPTEDLESHHFVAEVELQAKIKELITARTKAFRYAVLTQALAKASQQDLNCLVLQAGAGLPGAFDARSLCKKVVVPFEGRYFPGVLGTSQDPYVSKPLRRPRVTLEERVLREIKNKDEWKKLYDLLNAIEQRKDPDFSQRVLRQVLLEIRRLASQRLPRLPEKVSAGAIRAILEKYLARSTLGLGPQAVAYALLKVFNKRTRAYQEVISNPPTTPDAAAGRAADIECTGPDGTLQLAVCVTQRLDVQKLEEDLRKCSQSAVANVLFLASQITVDLEEAYRKAAEHRVNATINTLRDFVLSVTALLNGEMRRELIEEVVRVLDDWGGISAVTELTDVIREILGLP